MSAKKIRRCARLGHKSNFSRFRTFNYLDFYASPEFLHQVAVNRMGVEAIVIHMLMKLESGTFGYGSPATTCIWRSMIVLFEKGRIFYRFQESS